MLSKILAIDYLFDPANKNNPCVKEILYVVGWSMTPGNWGHTNRTSYEYKELQSKLNEIIEKYDRSVIIPDLKKALEGPVNSTSMINAGLGIKLETVNATQKQVEVHDTVVTANVIPDAEKATVKSKPIPVK